MEYAKNGRELFTEGDRNGRYEGGWYGRKRFCTEENGHEKGSGQKSER